MKLRNKKTGEIVDFGSPAFIIDNTKNNVSMRIKNLAELNKEWEDYEEPVKPYWFVNDLNGEPMKCDLKNCGKSNFTKWGEYRKQIGNYFETEEEAKKAVEKLKAWQRLRDIYFIKFDLDFVKNIISFTYRIDGTLHSSVNEERIIFEDMKTIFGGEE